MTTPPTPAPVINDATVQANQAQAAKLGIKIPGVGGGGTTTVNQNQPTGGNVTSPTGVDVFGNKVNAPVAQTNTSGSYVGIDGNTYDSSGKIMSSVPTQQPTTPGTGVTNIGGQNQTSNTQIPSTGNDNLDALEQQRQNDAATFAATGQQVSTAILNIQNGVTPLTAGENAQIQGLQQQFQTLIDQQNLANTGATGTAQVRGYQTGAAEYDPKFQATTIASIVSAGANKIADLQVKEASAVAQLTKGFHDDDIRAIKDAYSAYTDAYNAKTTALNDTIKDAQDAIKTAQDAATKAQEDYYTQVTKPIQDIQGTLAKAGAPKDVLAAAGNAQTVDDALAAGGTYLQSSTNPDIAQYLFYKQQADAAGTVPQSYDDFQKAQATLANQQAYSKAYATAKGTAEGQAAGAPPTDTPPATGLGGTSNGGSILNATGLSIGAFNYLTQGTASMSRMPVAQRNAIMKEAQNYLNNTGTDISTFQSQYKAYNDVIEKNIARAAQTRVMAGEVSGSADALISAIDQKDLGRIRAANILDLMAGKQVNDPITQKYSFQLQSMANDLAGYYAAARGDTAPNQADQRDAADVISSGMNKGSTQAFKDAINANEEKVNKVVNNAVTSGQQQVWSLFGVGDKYTSPTNTADTMIQQSADNPLNLSFNNAFSQQQVGDPLGIK